MTHAQDPEYVQPREVNVDTDGNDNIVHRTEDDRTQTILGKTPKPVTRHERRD